VTPEHVLFIPGVLILGIFLGFVLGGRAARNQLELVHKREAERVAAREARAAKKVAPAADAKEKDSA
jgi:hypothetical protein